MIRLKANVTLKKYSEDIIRDFIDIHEDDYTMHHVIYHTFDYQAGSWKNPHRVTCRVERSPGELLPRATFIVTTLKAESKFIVKYITSAVTWKSYKRS